MAEPMKARWRRSRFSPLKMSCFRRAETTSSRSRCSGLRRGRAGAMASADIGLLRDYERSRSEAAVLQRAACDQRIREPVNATFVANADHEADLPVVRRVAHAVLEHAHRIQIVPHLLRHG